MKNTKEIITNTTIQLFQENGYENTSVARICKACNITKGTFYYYFPNKDEIIFEYYEQMFQKYNSNMMIDLFNIDNYKEQLWSVVAYSIDNTISLTPSLLKAFMISDMQKGLDVFSPYKKKNSSTLRMKQYELLTTLVRKGQKHHEIKEGDPDMMVHTFTSALIGIAMDWASNDGKYNEKEELRKVFDVIF